jgi:hypothetical protein
METVMPSKDNVSVSPAPTKYRPNAKERRAAHLAEISSKQGELKREASERRAKIAGKFAGPGNPAAPIPREPAGGRRSHPV